MANHTLLRATKDYPAFIEFGLMCAALLIAEAYVDPYSMRPP
jgi:hypothetical protein